MWHNGAGGSYTIILLSKGNRGWCWSGLEQPHWKRNHHRHREGLWLLFKRGGGSDSLSCKAFIVLHSVIDVESDWKSCAKNVKREIEREVQTPAPFSPLHSYSISLLLLSESSKRLPWVNLLRTPSRSSGSTKTESSAEWIVVMIFLGFFAMTAISAKKYNNNSSCIHCDKRSL